MKSRVYDRFGKLARPYRFLERALMGRSLESVRTVFLDLPQVCGAQKVLIFGEGDGRFLEAALGRMPDAEFTVVESSRGMVAVAKERMGSDARNRVRFECVDAREFQGKTRAYDGVVMHCFLDCFTEETLSVHLPRWLENVKMEGWSWIGDYIEPRRLGWRWFQLRILYGFFRIMAGIEARHVHDPGTILSDAGFELAESESFHCRTCESRLYLRKPKG